MTTLPELPAGIYRHYKGHLYQALGYGCDANNREHIMVFYLGLELVGAQPGAPRFAARTAASSDPAVDAWWDNVHADGTKCTHDHKAGAATCSAGHTITPRFAYLGPTWQIDHNSDN